MSDIQFVSVMNDYVVDFINNAKKRILIIKPSYFKYEVQILLDIIKNKNIQCTLYLETGDQAVRFGYGDIEGLKLIYNNCNIINVQTAEYIRLSIIIVDDEVLVYSPIALYMEKEPQRITFPNGFYADKHILNQILSQFNLGKNGEHDIHNVGSKTIPFPGCKIDKKDENSIKLDMEGTIKKLADIPPVDPSKLRKINFYRSKYKLLKIQVWGAHINNRKISLKPFTSMLDVKDERLISSWSVFTKQEVDSINLLKLYQSEVEDLKKKHTLEAGRFGYIISIDNKKNMEDDLKKLNDEFHAFLKDEAKVDNKNRFKKANSKNNISKILQNSLESLKKYIVEKANEDQNFFEKYVSNDRYIMNKHENDDKGAFNEYIDEIIYNKLKFPNGKDIVDRVDVKLDYYDISDELLYENEEFKTFIEKYKDENNAPEGLFIRDYSDGFERE